MSEDSTPVRIEACESCRFFEPFGTNDYGDGAGYCRRYPPKLSAQMVKQLATWNLNREGKGEAIDSQSLWETMLLGHDDQTNWQWPVVSANHDWCGEFRTT